MLAAVAKVAKAKDCQPPGAGDRSGGASACCGERSAVCSHVRIARVLRKNAILSSSQMAAVRYERIVSDLPRIASTLRLAGNPRTRKNGKDYQGIFRNPSILT